MRESRERGRGESGTWREKRKQEGGDRVRGG